MKTVELYFYKGWEYGGVLSKIVCLFSLGPHSHVEAYFPAKDKRYTALPEEGTVCFAGSVENKAHWDMIEITCSEYQEKVWSRCFERGLNMEYDYRGCFGCLFKHIKQDKKKYFCTEYVLTGMKWVKLYKGDVVLSPSEMYKRLTKEK